MLLSHEEHEWTSSGKKSWLSKHGSGVIQILIVRSIPLQFRAFLSPRLTSEKVVMGLRQHLTGVLHGSIPGFYPTPCPSCVCVKTSTTYCPLTGLSLDSMERFQVMSTHSPLKVWLTWRMEVSLLHQGTVWKEADGRQQVPDSLALARFPGALGVERPTCPRSFPYLQKPRCSQTALKARPRSQSNLFLKHLSIKTVSVLKHCSLPSAMLGTSHGLILAFQ